MTSIAAVHPDAPGATRPDADAFDRRAVVFEARAAHLRQGFRCGVALIIIGLVLPLAGVCLGIWRYGVVAEQLNQQDHLRPPGTEAAPLVPGRHVVYQVRGNSPMSATDLSISDPAGRPVVLQSRSGSINFSSNDFAYRQVASFDATSPGTYRFTSRRTADPIVVGDDHANLDHLMVDGCLAGLFVAGLGGATVWLSVRLVRVARRQATATDHR